MENSRPYDIESYFRAKEEAMLRDSKGVDTISHKPGQGGEREELVRQFLREHLPLRYGVVNGEVRDLNNRRSTQFDGLVIDRLNHPKPYEEKSFQVVPIESLYATIEVKKNLDRRAIRESVDAISKFQILDFNPRGRKSVEIDEDGNRQVISLSHIPHFIVAFDGLQDPGDVRIALNEIYTSANLSPVEILSVQPHCLCVLGKYALLAGVRGPQHSPGFVRIPSERVPLLAFFLSLVNTIQDIHLSPFNLLHYENIREYYSAFSLIPTDSIKS